ncbi:unnamed protein product [Prorocentrum cordatum]|uniref:2-phospho-L-lactate guanylyltransferase n=1 Tax=Prorocentrum cordatum TaxID=2364126 RepID=A0ABN9R0X4_9DINO|nr:unnamed protein product [Polarella glacialis]
MLAAAGAWPQPPRLELLALSKLRRRWARRLHVCGAAAVGGGADTEPIPFCIFAKPPRPGRAKTRLAAGIGAEAACRLATCFLSDTLRLALGEARLLPVLATTDDGMPEGAFPGDAFPEGVAPGSVTRWLQPEGDLGARTEGHSPPGAGERSGRHLRGRRQPREAALARAGGARGVGRGS